MHVLHTTMSHVTFLFKNKKSKWTWLLICTNRHLFRCCAHDFLKGLAGSTQSSYSLKQRFSTWGAWTPWGCMGFKSGCTAKSQLEWTKTICKTFSQCWLHDSHWTIIGCVFNLCSGHLQQATAFPLHKNGDYCRSWRAWGAPQKI